MPANVSRKSVYQVLDRAAKTLVSAAGTDGRATKAEVTEKLKELSGNERALVDTFFKFMDHRDPSEGARVTPAAVKSALTYAKSKLVDAYDADGHGLSAAERAKMSNIGKLASQIAEAKLTPKQAAKETARLLVEPKWNADALPAVPVSDLSASAKRSFDAMNRSAIRNQGLIDAPIARKLTAGGEQFTVVAQFTHDSFGIELYDSKGRKFAHGSGWGTPDAPIEWK